MIYQHSKRKLVILLLLISFTVSGQDNRQIKIKERKPKKEHHGLLDMLSSTATVGYSRVELNPLSVGKQFNTSGGDGVFGIAVEFKVSYPGDDSLIWQHSSSDNFVRFISIGVNALSERFLLDPNQWHIDNIDSSVNYRINLESAWSPAIRYGSKREQWEQEVIQTDKEPDAAYEYRWRFFGNAVNALKDMRTFTCQINIEIQRKSYFSTEFKPLKKTTSKESLREDIQSAIVNAYNSYFRDIGNKKNK